jgi:hypothetical protein
MKRLSIQTKKIPFRAFLRALLWLIPAFVILCVGPYFPFFVKAVKAAELSEIHLKSQPGLNDSQISINDGSVERPLPQPLVIDDRPDGLLLKSQVKVNFYGKTEPEIDIFENKSSAFENTLLSSNLGSNGPDKKLEIFRVKQKVNDFIYGVEYRSVGKNLKNLNDYKKKTNTQTNVDLKNDQEGVEIWGTKKMGPVGLKTFFSRFWNNVDRDPKQTNLMANKYGLEMNYKLDFLPIYFSLSHSRLQSESTVESYSPEYQGIRKETYGGALYYYGGRAFNMTVSSNFSPISDLDDQKKVTHSYWHEISASIMPTSNLYITPTLSFGEYRYLWYGEQTENPSISLSITRSQLLNMIDLSLWGELSRSRNTDGYQDSETLNTSAEISWNAKYLFFPKARFSLDLGYDQYDDKIYQSSSYDSFSASFQLKFQL